ncbi:1,6-anhydro-N-acetylmuramyl-L-alanine amidase AmpD [Marinimicrobium sp. ABcell2]|uniref:1,6-anhydro-N-acetylmuramyl-L-alanine amidase AmpD n=1 Tax=Marinimicrobium sp. ABcell2 TaxID=3069751 RepID=UPI0027AEC48C|nr:1,6-anhydro-N-acetylmuramyl-L-alanine amidase AmpD [Marinimicrobium sp. ABcell2]MDQ2078299.1 1,6-anhydro-N-acetylmuramyl-L-alanine amidase AmpD [Marinimicrobium sp. ABcell2]
MNEQIRNGWLASAQACPSPNFNPRPAGSVVSLLVIHNISLPPGQFGTGCVQQFFCNQLDSQQDPYFATIADLRVSSHLFIERDGGLTQFVSLSDRAWHAGASSFESVTNCNDYSIGIELEGCDDIAYTEAQYQRLAGVTALLLSRFPALSEQRVVGHQDIAPGRKTDPGEAFDWLYFRSLLKQHLSTNHKIEPI